MKGITQKIALSVLALVITAVTLTAGVWAWFVVNNTAKVDQIGGQVESGTGGFMIAATKSGQANKDWTTSLSLTDYSVTDLTDLTLKGVNLVKQENQDADYGKGYLTFDLYFAAGSTFNNIILSDISIVSRGSSNWTAPTGITGVTSFSEHASNAARVGFFNGSSLISAYQQTEGTDENTLGQTGGKALEYYNKVSGKTAIVAPASEYTAKEVVTNATEAIVALGSAVTTLPDGYPAATESMTVGADAYSKFAKVTVKIWIEGWDGEAFNAIQKGGFDVSMTFKAV